MVPDAETSSQARLVIELQPTEDDRPPAGTIGRAAEGALHPFSGWLELMALVDQLRTVDVVLPETPGVLERP
jgi:hypothetical protein